jgi:hypothetical protein
MEGDDGCGQGDDDRRLMRRIYYQWDEALRDACRWSSVPAEFLATLIANESGGEPGRTQFQPQVYRGLLAVRSGEQLHYATVTREDLRVVKDEQLMEYAATYGLTQIMGCQVLRDRVSPHRLLEPEFNLRKSLQLLAIFAEYCQLDLGTEFEELLRCWNTGRPDGVTADPEYVQNGLRRMAVYRELSRPIAVTTRVELAAPVTAVVP